MKFTSANNFLYKKYQVQEFSRNQQKFFEIFQKYLKKYTEAYFSLGESNLPSLHIASAIAGFLRNCTVITIFENIAMFAFQLLPE